MIPLHRGRMASSTKVGVAPQRPTAETNASLVGTVGRTAKIGKEEGA